VSRRNFRTDDGRLVIWGDDPAFDTWYAQRYDDPDKDAPHGAPNAVIGYHPTEVSLAKRDRPDIDVGPYPVASHVQLSRLVKERWGLALPV
jgi:hypothetical protein